MLSLSDARTRVTFLIFPSSSNPHKVRQVLNDHFVNKHCPEDTDPWSSAITNIGQQHDLRIGSTYNSSSKLHAVPVLEVLVVLHLKHSKHESPAHTGVTDRTHPFQYHSFPLLTPHIPA